MQFYSEESNEECRGLCANMRRVLGADRKDP